MARGCVRNYKRDRIVSRHSSATVSQALAQHSTLLLLLLLCGLLRRDLELAEHAEH